MATKQKEPRAMIQASTGYDKQWHVQYGKLVDLKRKNGHCITPINGYEHDKAFGNWVCRQRCIHASNKMRPERKDLLDELEFVWRVEIADNQDKQWRQQYEKLVEFKRKNGHCMVPKVYEQDKSLGTWVKTQRGLQSKNKMRQDRKEMLDELRFAWRLEIADSNHWRTYRCSTNYDKKWCQQYDKLVELKRKNVHFVLPNIYEQDKGFANWVHQQRFLQTKNRMRKDRKDLLDKLEFVWRADTIAARSSTTTMEDVRSLVVIVSFHAWVKCFFSLAFFSCLTFV
jgi:hypothetical protein